jgi:hypothetical protein
MKTKLHISRILISLLALGLASGTAIALAQPDMPKMEPLVPLKDALTAAGAPELTSAQEDAIETLVTEFRGAHHGPFENEDIQNARAAYEEAILNGDSAAAASQAAILGKAQADSMVQRESDAADFAVNVIRILKEGPGQADALIAQMGSRNFVRMILSLAGGPRGPGGPGPGRGRPAPPPFVAP